MSTYYHGALKVECFINPQSQARWHLAAPASGLHLASTRDDSPLPPPSSESSWLTVNKRGRGYLMCLASGKQIRLKRRNFCFSTHQRLSFNYAASEKYLEGRELSGKYIWKYQKTTMQYFLTKKGELRVYAMMAFDPNCFNGVSGKFHMYDKCNVVTSEEPSENAEGELDTFIYLSILELLLYQENKTLGFHAGDKTREDDVMDCGCVCHCIPGKCTWTKFGAKMKDMFNVTVREVNEDEKDLPTYSS
ncbi:uncharacterized protein EAF02_003833 [Botrytis sinoallii]|uniref:uncharacterized protein n=1 Tax=Botrytis sinoallii TaxID=1463999 RepID=UPI00190188CA|nr:uncharacterized protein EAF02_003833 [Botrytis sinoallii]KAF7887186.1 hypothetical protein EAF02_003833 [Botrytis sinoallii]